MCDKLLRQCRAVSRISATFQVFLPSTAQGCHLKKNILKIFQWF